MSGGTNDDDRNSGAMLLGDSVALSCLKTALTNVRLQTLSSVDLSSMDVFLNGNFMHASCLPVR